MRHFKATCWKKPYQVEQLEDAHVDSGAEHRLRACYEQPLRREQDPDPPKNQVRVVMVDRGENVQDVEAATKSIAEDALVTKQAFPYGTTNMSALPDPRLWLPFIARKESSSTAVRNVKHKRKKQVNRMKKSWVRLQGYAGNYNVIEELANASTGVNLLCWFEEMPMTQRRT